MQNTNNDPMNFDIDLDDAGWEDITVPNKRTIEDFIDGVDEDALALFDPFDDRDFTLGFRYEVGIPEEDFIKLGADTLLD